MSQLFANGEKKKVGGSLPEPKFFLLALHGKFRWRIRGEWPRDLKRIDRDEILRSTN